MRFTYCGNCFGIIREGEDCIFCGRKHQQRKPGTISGTYQKDTERYQKIRIGDVVDRDWYSITYKARGKDIETGEDHLLLLREFYPEAIVSRGEIEEQYPLKGGAVIPWEGKEDLFQEGKKLYRQLLDTLAACRERPCIDSTVDSFEANGTLYAVMPGLRKQQWITGWKRGEPVQEVPYRDGQTLEELLEREGRLEWEQARDVFMPILSDLVEAQEKGFFHKCICPDRIFLDEEGMPLLLGMGDSVFAQWGTFKEAVCPTHLETWAGEPVEWLSTRKTKGGYTDVYALAACMYQAVTGKPVQSALDRIGEGGEPWETSPEPYLGKERTEILEKALALMERDRYQTVAQFRDALERIDRQEADTAREKSPDLVSFQAPAGQELWYPPAQAFSSGGKLIGYTIPGRKREKRILSRLKWKQRRGMMDEEYLYDISSKLVRVDTWDGPGRLCYETLYTYDDQGHLLKERSRNIKEDTVWYDTYSWFRNRITGKQGRIERERYLYNRDGRLIWKEKYLDLRSFSSICSEVENWAYEYDQEGRLLEEKYQIRGLKDWVPDDRFDYYNFEPARVHPVKHTRYFYENGRLQETISEGDRRDGPWKETYEYDSRGKQTRSIRISDDGQKITECKAIYDAWGYLRETQTWINGELEERDVYEVVSTYVWGYEA